jgi:FSR family fosmidomycin resistance protein-like MFS transporter
LQALAGKSREENGGRKTPLPLGKTIFSILILLVLIFSKYIYMTSLYSYYTFYLIEKFDVTIQTSQILLFVFLSATAIGTMVGGPVSDKIGRKYVIWISILGASPFALLMPHVGLFWTVILSFCTGFILSSAFPAIIVYAQELLPFKLGLISGLFYGFAFGIAGIASAILGKMADVQGIESIYQLCAYMPLLGLIAWLLPDLRKKR